VSALRNTKKKKILSYTEQRLGELGLTSRDISSMVGIYRVDAYEQEKLLEELTIQRITPGSFGPRWDIVEGPDMVFHYVTLDRRRATYLRDGRGVRLSTFYRLRHSNPALHPDKYNRPVKYKSPPGAGIRLWYPEATLRMYETQKQFDTLYIIEGELKAEMGAKFGMPMVGIGGIQNLADKELGLPRDFEMIIRNCGVRKIVFLTDADCFDLSDDLAESPGKRADGRPYNFFAAVNNFREYFAAFGKTGLDLELFFGHINPGREKGLDDLLAGSAKSKEAQVEGELRRLTMEKTRKDDGVIAPIKGDWTTIFALTDTSKSAVKKIWALHDAQAFAKKYRDILIPMGKFLFWKDLWKIDSHGAIELAQPVLPEERYWSYNDSGKVNFQFIGLITFLGNRDYGRFAHNLAEYCFIQLDGRIVSKVEAWQIRDYVTDFTERIGEKGVLEMLYRHGKTYLGGDALGNLKFIDTHFAKPDPHCQFLYFQNQVWEVRKEGVAIHAKADLPHHVWKDHIRDFDVTRHGDRMVRFRDLREGGWALEFSERGQRFDLLQFLYLASEYNWRDRVENEEKPGWQYKPWQAEEHRLSLASKLTAIGYMLHRYSPATMRKAVIAMDVRNSEVGTSQGRSGKSLLGVILEKMVPTVYIDGKQRKMGDDQFLFEEVEPSTGVIWVDDLRANFDFESFFAVVTGKITINKKGKGKYKLATEQVIKLYMSTNHAILGDGDSFADRQILLGFSDYFDKERKPAGLAGRLFFDDYEPEDWNDFFNLMACCLQMYFEKGVVEMPPGRLELRKHRQEMGEDFLAWAEHYFSDAARLNTRLDRKELQNEVEVEVKAAKMWSSAAIKRKFIAYCRYAGLHFNPERPDESGQSFDRGRSGHIHVGAMDKRNSREFFTFADRDYLPSTANYPE